MRVDDVAHDAQSDAGAPDLGANRATAAEERLEDVWQIVGVDAKTAVSDADANGRILYLGGHVDRGAARAVLHRIADDVLHG